MQDLSIMTINDSCNAVKPIQMTWSSSVRTNCSKCTNRNIPCQILCSNSNAKLPLQLLLPLSSTVTKHHISELVRKEQYLVDHKAWVLYVYYSSIDRQLYWVYSLMRNALTGVWLRWTIIVQQQSKVCMQTCALLYIAAIYCTPDCHGIVSQLITGNYVIKFERDSFKVQLSARGIATCFASAQPKAQVSGGVDCLCLCLPSSQSQKVK